MKPTVVMRSRSSAPVSALVARRPGTVESFFGENHEINAGSQQELMVNLGRLMQAVASGQIVMKTPEEVASVNEAAENRSMIAAAYKDRTSAQWAETGAAIGAEVSEVADREGFMRRFMVRGDVAQGSQPRVRVRVKSVTALWASGPSQNQAILARDRYLYPPEFYITANVRVEEREIQQGSGDILEDVFFNTQEQIMVEEDRYWKQLADGTVGLQNPLQVLAGGLTPTSLAATRNEVTSWGIPAQWLLFASDLWNDVIGNASQWGNLFDPVTQFEIIQTGYLGTLLGMSIVTDAYRQPQLKVLNAGEMYVIGAPDMHGVYTDRGPVTSEPRDSFNDGVPARGWYFYELMSMTIHNARSIVKGVRS